MNIEKCPRCNKNWYMSESDAIARAIDRSRHAGKGIRVYQCPTYKGRFHLTSQKTYYNPKETQ